MEALSDTVESSTILSELERAINDEILAAYQYWTAYQISAGPSKYDADDIFLEHVSQEWEHVEALAKRIRELGGKFCLDLAEIRNHANPWTPVSAGDVRSLASLILQYEKRAVAKYTRLLEMCRDVDPVTHKILQGILATETEHEYEIDVLLHTL